MKAIFLGIILFIFTSIVWGIFNLGIFKKVSFESTTSSSVAQYHLFAVAHTGAYHKINDTLIELETWATQNNLPCAETFGLFYDDPDLVEESRLRADVGCLMAQTETFQFEQKLNEATLGDKIKPRLLTLTTDTSLTLKAQFGGSPWLGPYKVYSAAKDHFRDLNQQFHFPVLEIYKIKELPPRTEYLFFAKPPQITP